MKAAFGPGATFAGYRVESVVGRGGMGVVYRATDLSLERPVALKMIAPELAGDEHFRSRFLREPRLAASLDHPNVIPIYEAGEHEEHLYLAMRFVEGSDLGSVLEREGRLAPERALRVLGQVAGALDAAHRRALVHRDVKPANVLLDDHEHVYLTDFGISKQTGGASTDTGRMVGTLDYLAPEQIRGDPVDGRTDVYALGCLLYECLAGAPPFRRATEAETLWAHMQEEPPPLQDHAALDPVLRKALAKEREDRYATCTELVDAARAALGLAVGPVGRAATRRARRRPGRLLLAGGLLLAAAVAAAAIAALTAGRGSEAQPVGNGVAALGGADAQLASFTKTGTAPSNVAVGEGDVWALSLEDRTVARIDPETKRVAKRFRMRETPIDLAVGLGALWVMTGEGVSWRGVADGAVSRIDPETGVSMGSVKLPDAGYQGDLGFLNWGFPQIAVGAGAVWAINPDRTVSRIDPETGKRGDDRRRRGHDRRRKRGRLVHRHRRQPRRHPDRPEHQPRGAANPSRRPEPVRGGRRRGLCLGIAQGDGVVWRIEPGPEPDTSDDRRRSRRHVRSLRRWGGLGGELQRRHRGRASTWRRTTSRRRRWGPYRGWRPVRGRPG